MKNFDFSNVELVEVPTKTRTTGDDKAYVSTSTTPGRFNVNSLASQMMDAKSGDKIFFFEDKRIEDLDARFFIGLAETDNCAALYSPAKADKAGVALSFNHAGIFARILQGDPKAAELSMERLEEKGLAVSRASSKNPKKRNFSATATTRFELVEAMVINLKDIGEVQMYALVNPVVKTIGEEEVDSDGSEQDND